MAMNVGSGSSDGEVLIDINTTPLIDVMLVLLIMLIITIPMQTHAVKIEFPPPQPYIGPRPPVVDILIDFDGSIYWNNDVLPDRPTLDAKFDAIGRELTDDQPEIHIRPNKLVDYQYVAAVMASAQHHNAVKIALLGSEQFVDQ